MDIKYTFTKKQKIIAAIGVGIATVFMLLLCFYTGRRLMSFVSEPARFREWVKSKGVLGMLAYAGMVMLQVVLAVIPGEPIEICGGYAFGAVYGTVLCMIGAAIGSIIVFFFVRYFGIKLVYIFFSKDKVQKLQFLRVSEKRDILFAIIFMLPGTPKDLLCYFAGMTDIKVGTWLIICSIGRLPSIITSTVGGDALGTKRYLEAVIVFIVTMAVSISGILLYRYFLSKHKKGKENSSV